MRPFHVAQGSWRSVSTRVELIEVSQDLRLNRLKHRARVVLHAADTNGNIKVVVTGAAGRTGTLICKKLAAARPSVQPRAVVRSDKSKAQIVQLGIPSADVFFADVGLGDAAALAAAFAGRDALIIATSAVPQLKPLSLIPVLLAKLFRKEGVRPEFSWKSGQRPEQVDWLGQKAQIDAAKSAGIHHVVLVSSMGGTQADNALNQLGGGNILQWKRKAEQYLVASGLKYTIIHPGGLIDDKGGERQLVLGVDDELLKRTVRSIPREDVAELAVRCLRLAAAENRSFDVITLPRGEGVPTQDWAALLDGLGGATCNYAINDQWGDGAA